MAWLSRFLLLLLLHHLLLKATSEAAPSSAENARKSDGLIKRVVDKMLKNYTRQNSPNGDSTTTVYIGIYVIGFYSISEATMDYSLTIYLRLQWTDPRLSYNSSEVGGKAQIKLEDNIWEKIWVPDVFLRNEKKAAFHSVTIPNRFMNLEPNGRIWYVIKLSITLSCEMNLKKYPLDTQMCPMMFESFGHTMDTVAFKWLQPPRRPDDIPEDLTMPQFDLKNVHLKSCDLNYTTGAYPCLQMTFELKRDFGYFLIQIYIPTVLIVILSWFSFWLNIDSVPGRVSLGLLTVLTITTQASSAKSSLPKVSYIKAIDVWMSVCLGFVFASLLEFAIVNVYSREESSGAAAKRQQQQLRSRNRRSGGSGGGGLLRRVGRKRGGIGGGGGGGGGGGSSGLRIRTDSNSPVFMRDTVLMLEEAPPPSPPQAQSAAPPMPKQRPNMPTAKKIDKFSRRFFPLSFALFNVVYWVYYLIIA